MTTILADHAILVPQMTFLRRLCFRPERSLPVALVVPVLNRNVECLRRDALNSPLKVQSLGRRTATIDLFEQDIREPRDCRNVRRESVFHSTPLVSVRTSFQSLSSWPQTTASWEVFHLC